LKISIYGFFQGDLATNIIFQGPEKDFSKHWCNNKTKSIFDRLRGKGTSQTPEGYISKYIYYHILYPKISKKNIYYPFLEQDIMKI
jgi:hypothetical protein